jgi:putative hydrolase of the HAD superfamily
MLKVIAFDADDTLWHNEAFFQETEKKFCVLIENYLPQHTIARELLHTEKILSSMGMVSKHLYSP